MERAEKEVEVEKKAETKVAEDETVERRKSRYCGSGGGDGAVASLERVERGGLV